MGGESDMAEQGRIAEEYSSYRRMLQVLKETLIALVTEGGWKGEDKASVFLFSTIDDLFDLIPLTALTKLSEAPLASQGRSPGGRHR